jgi:uncharacterized oxidoreductase
MVTEMRTKGNTVLITGGATGIGLSLAEEFVNANNEVIICGRRIQKLKDAKQKLPRIHTRVCDLSKEDDRASLHEWASATFPKLNILVNNAGIQRMIDFRQGPSELINGEDEVGINLVAPIRLSAYFIPQLANQKEAAIINVSSGLGFIPLSIMPVYCATKAALHSFSLSLRHQLRSTAIKVFEVIPPTTDTELDHGARGKRGQTDRGIPPEEVAQATLNGLEKDLYEIAVGQAEGLRRGARENPDEIFQNMNRF